MSTFHLSVLAADKVFFEGWVESLVVPITDGEYGILAHHSNMMSAVSTGLLKFRPEGEEERIASVSDGVVKVEHGKVLVLVNTAERPEEIDAIRAQLEIDHAKEVLLQKKSIAEYQSSRAQMARAMSRLKAKNYNKRV